MNRPVIDQLSSDIQEYIISLEKIVEENNNRIQDLEIMLQNMQRMLFGRKSEKAVLQVPVSVGEQLNIFNEAEESADSTVPDPLVEEVEVAAHKRKKSSRREKFGNFPVIAHEYMLGEEEQNCDRCGSRMELRQLLFDDLRMDESAFRGTNWNDMMELAELYHTANHRLLISMVKEMKRHEQRH